MWKKDLAASRHLGWKEQCTREDEGDERDGVERLRETSHSLHLIAWGSAGTWPTAHDQSVGI